VVNPAQSIDSIQIPRLSREQAAITGGRVIFCDAGYHLCWRRSIELDRAVGRRRIRKYANTRYDLGIQDDVVIRAPSPLAQHLFPQREDTIQASVDAPQNGDLRIVMQQRYVTTEHRAQLKGVRRTAQNGQVFVLSASQAGKASAGRD